MNFFKLFGGCIAFFSCTIVGFAISELIAVLKFKSTGNETIGIVDSIYVASNTDWEGRMYVVKFSPNCLDTFKVENTFSTSMGSRFVIGDSVPVVFLKNDPETARFSTVKDLYLPLIIDLLIIILLTSFACFLILRSEKIAKFIGKLKQSEL